ATYNGTAHTITAALVEDATATCTVDPASVTNVGSHAGEATCTSLMCTVPGTSTVTVNECAGTVQVAETSFTYANTDFSLVPSMAEESDASCTASPETVRDAGTVSVGISCTGTNYDASGSINVTVARAVTQIELDPATFAYDNSEHA